MISLLFTLLTLHSEVSVDILSKMRSEFHDLNESELVDQFILRYKGSLEEKNIPYVAGAITMKAKYVFSPFKKIKHFKHGKKMLEEYILKNSNCIEGRYIRFLVQRESPGILGYKSDMQSDRIFILDKIGSSDLPSEYRKLIIENINDN